MRLEEQVFGLSQGSSVMLCRLLDLWEPLGPHLKKESFDHNPSPKTLQPEPSFQEKDKNINRIIEADRSLRSASFNLENDRSKVSETQMRESWI